MPVNYTAAPIARVLEDPEEWAERLQGTDLQDTPLDPKYTRVIVVEVAGKVVACVAAFNSVHVESFWEGASHRGNVGVSRALLGGLVGELTKNLVGEVLSQAGTPEMEAMFERVGGRQLPGTTWVLPLEEVKTWVG